MALVVTGLFMLAFAVGLLIYTEYEEKKSRKKS